LWASFKSVSVVVRRKFFSGSLSATRPARFTAFALLFFLFGRLLKETDLRFDATCDFNLIEKRVRGDTAIPFDVDKSTPHVIDDTLDGPLSETPDQSLVGSDLFRGTTFHAVLVQVAHLRTPPSNQRAPSRLSVATTGGGSFNAT
jgi:hypothetical protein